MTTLLQAPRLHTLGPKPLRWTCAEFHRFGDLGLFEGRRAMLIEGVILEEGPMNPPHAIALELAADVLRAIFGTGWRVRCQAPLVLGQDLDPEPDFAVVAGSARGSTGHPTSAALVVEIADTSLAFDMNEKRLLYARSSIAEYWIVDLNARQLHVHRAPQAGDYVSVQMLDATANVNPLAAPTATVRIAELLP